MFAFSIFPEWFSTLPPWQFYAFIASVTLALALIFRRLSKHLFKLVLSEADSGVRRIIVDEIPLPTFLTVLSIGLYVATTKFTLSATTETFLISVVETVILVVWSRATIRIGKKGLSLLEERRQSFDFLPLFETIYSLVIAAITITLILSVWKIDITPLLASAGVAGIAIGFAAKDTVANFFGAIALYMDDTYRVGDYIVLDSGEEGVVKEISMRSTVLRTLDDTLVTVPNSSLNSSVVVNESSPVDSKRLRTTVSVAYGSDLEIVEELLVDAAKESKSVLDTPKPAIRLSDFGGSGIEYEVQVWTSPKNPARTRHELLGNIHDKFDEKDIEIPYPQRTLHFAESDVKDI